MAAAPTPDRTFRKTVSVLSPTRPIRSTCSAGILPRRRYPCGASSPAPLSSAAWSPQSRGVSPATELRLRGDPRSGRRWRLPAHARADSPSGSTPRDPRSGQYDLEVASSSLSVLALSTDASAGYRFPKSSFDFTWNDATGRGLSPTAQILAAHKQRAAMATAALLGACHGGSVRRQSRSSGDALPCRTVSIPSLSITLVRGDHWKSCQRPGLRHGEKETP